MRRVFCLLLPFIVAGCVTRFSLAPEHLKGLRYAEGGGRVVEHYQIQNYGWYLFDTLPIICGDLDKDAKLCFTLFSDQVRTDLLTKEFNDRVRETGTRPVCVNTLNTDLKTFEIPGISFPLILPYIICYREVQISGVLVKDDEPPTEEKEPEAPVTEVGGGTMNGLEILRKEML